MDSILTTEAQLDWLDMWGSYLSPQHFLPKTCATRKQTLRSLSLSYQKKDGRTWPHPSFFWYDTDFSEFESADIIDYILKKYVSCQKKDGP